MRRTIILSAILCLAGASAGSAQPGPGGPPPPPGQGPPSTADFLLGHTGELRLTDAQVTRLAAIARRTFQEREAARAEMRRDTARREPGTRAAGPPPAEMERRRSRETAERRDALAVLTADQQAEAWGLIQRGRERGPGSPRPEGGPEHGRGAPGPR